MRRITVVVALLILLIGSQPSMAQSTVTINTPTPALQNCIPATMRFVIETTTGKMRHFPYENSTGSTNTYPTSITIPAANLKTAGYINGRCKQTSSNLVSNAGRYSTSASRIQITLNNLPQLSAADASSCQTSTFRYVLRIGTENVRIPGSSVANRSYTFRAVATPSTHFSVRGVCRATASTRVKTAHVGVFGPAAVSSNGDMTITFDDN